jgi:serine phosphatase RsbU (regulator of sigma subunit)
MDGAVAGPGTRVGSPALLPVDWSQFHGVDLYAQHHPSCRGGDFFDGLSIGQHVLFVLTDIAGTEPQDHDVALELQNVFRQRAKELFAAEEVNESDAIAALAHAFNLSVIEAHGVRPAPTFLGCFNLALGILTYCNAGLVVLLREGGTVRALEPSGMVLGLFTHATFEAAILVLQEGDSVLLATNGVTEGRRGGAEFGVERVARLLRNSTTKSASEICEVILGAAYDFANHPWFRFLGFLRANHRCRQNDLTALALVRPRRRQA